MHDNAKSYKVLEEMGYQSSKWVDLGSYELNPNRGIATMHLFLALDAEYISPPNSDDLEDQELLFLSKRELKEALQAGDFAIVKIYF